MKAKAVVEAASEARAEGEAVEEARGETKGKAESEAKGKAEVILNMLKTLQDVKKAAELAGVSVEKVQEIADANHLQLS